MTPNPEAAEQRVAELNDMMRAADEHTDYLEQRVAELEAALRKIEALRTNEHAAGFDEAREMAAEALGLSGERTWEN